jgi:serine/threonine protein kinase
MDWRQPMAEEPTSEFKNAIRAQLHKVLHSRLFQFSELQRQFLTFIVGKTLDGAAAEIKEYSIGAEAFGRGVDFDPRIDSVVRVVARRVRDRLAEYYRGEGRDDPIIIQLPKGGYVPVFVSHEKAVSPKVSDAQPQSPGPGDAPRPEPGETGLVGSTVCHYEILELLGRGATGVVYRAEDLRLRRGVALKFLAPEFSGDAARLERFRREARAASAVNHPGVCAIYDVGDHQGRSFFAMELVEGQTLDEFVRAKPLPLETLFDLGIQIADALATAHAQGVFHRDVRPGNIIVNQRRQAKLLDFSAAESLREQAAAAGRAEGELTALQNAGTAPARARADVRGLGAILYEMATGRRPSSPDAPLHGGVPAGLATLIQRALNQDSNLHSVLEIHDELARLKRSWDLQQSAVQEPNRLPRARRAWFAALPVALLASAAAFWLFLPISPPRIVKYTQLTHDGTGKLEPYSNGIDGVVVTDGPRIYYSAVSGTRIVISEVAAAGGDTVPLQETAALVVKEMSPDRSKMLVTDFYRLSPDLPLKILPLPGGSAQIMAKFYRPRWNLVSQRTKLRLCER